MPHNEVFVTPPADFSLTQTELDTLVQANEEWERSAASSRDYLKAHHYKERGSLLLQLGSISKLRSR